MHQFFAKSVACNEAQKNEEFQEKAKKIQNHEGSYNLGKTFWKPKKLLISSMEKKYQLCALLESGIEGLKFFTQLSYKWDAFLSMQVFSSQIYVIFIFREGWGDQ